VVTPLEGLRQALPGVELVVVADDDPAAAARAAADADAAIIVAGYTAADEGERADPNAFTKDLIELFPPIPAGQGERSQASMAGTEAIDAGGDRERLTLRPIDEEIIRATAAANPRTIVTIIAAGAVITEAWRHEVPAIVMGWYAGMEGGNGLADVLLGAADPSGRLPFSVPTSEGHLPFFDRDATAITYDRWHGQRLLDRLGVEPAFPFGFGLSYTTFSIDGLQVGSAAGESAVARVTVANTGERAGRHVVQVYGRRPAIGDRVLLGFCPVELAAGETHTVDVQLSLRPLTTWDAATGTLRLPSGDIPIDAGSHAGDPDAVSATLVLA